MIEETISTEAARRFYDRLGVGHDRAEIYEGQAKGRGLTLLDLRPGQRVLNAGVGTGREHGDIQQRIEPEGVAVGLDYLPGDAPTQSEAHRRSALRSPGRPTPLRYCQL